MYKKNIVINIYKRISFKYKLLISYLCVCMIPLLLTVFMIYKTSAESLENDAKQKATLYSTQIVHNMESFINSYVGITKLLTVDYDIIKTLDYDSEASIYEQLNQNLAVRRLLMRVSLVRSDIKNVMLITTGKKLYQYSPIGISINQDELLLQDWYKKILESEDTVYVTATHRTDYYESGKDGLTVSVVRRIYSNNGKEAGILLVDIDPYSFVELSDIFKLEGIQEKVRITVKNKNGGIIYDSAVTEGLTTWYQLLNEETLPLNSKQGFKLEKSTNDGLLFVTISIPETILLAGMNKLSTYVLWIVIIMFMIIIVLSATLAKGITYPIIYLKNQMNQVVQGDYNKIETSTSLLWEVDVLITHYNKMIETIQHLINEVYLEKIKQQDATLMALRTQINPHVLYNTLEAIRMKAVVKGDFEVANMIKIMAKMFRATLDTETDTNTIQSELIYIQNYIELQNIRFHNRFQFTSKIADTYLKVPIIPIIFQPFIENSIEHGGRASHNILKIEVELTAINNILQIHFRDNGTGMSVAQKEQLNNDFELISQGKITLPQGYEKIALRNIAERIYLKYGEGYGIYINYSNDNGTEFLVNIPYEEI